MKRKCLFLVMFLAGIQWTFCDEQVTANRSITQLGSIVSIGDPTLPDPLGFGLSFLNFSYFDPAYSDGFYYGFLSGALGHTAGGVTLADTRLVTLGWRGNPLSFFGKPPLSFQADLSFSPTLGARLVGNDLLGSSYTGVGFTLGLYWPIQDGFDLGVSWEPVLNLYNWGAPDCPNKSYSDFVFYLTIKNANEVRAKAWKDPLMKPQ